MLVESVPAISSILLVDAYPIKTNFREHKQQSDHISFVGLQGDVAKREGLPNTPEDFETNQSLVKYSNKSREEKDTWHHFKPSSLDYFFNGKNTILIMRDHHHQGILELPSDVKDNHLSCGIVPQSLKFRQTILSVCNDIFDTLEQSQKTFTPLFGMTTKSSTHWESNISYLRIYDKKVYDLLGETRDPILVIHDTEEFSSEPHQVPIENFHDLQQILDQANAFNYNSSGLDSFKPCESHIIFSLYISGKDDFGMSICNRFGLIYLAQCKQPILEGSIGIDGYFYSLQESKNPVSSAKNNSSSNSDKITSATVPDKVDLSYDFDLFESNLIDKNTKRFFVDYIRTRKIKSKESTIVSSDKKIAEKKPWSLQKAKLGNDDIQRMDPLMGNLNDTLLRGEVINRSSDRHEVNALKLSMDSMVETNDEVRISSSEYLALYNLVACLKSEISSSRKTVRYYSQLNSLALGKTQKMASLIADNQMPLKPTNRKPTQHPQVNPDVNKSYQAWKSVDLENEKGTFVKHTDFIATEEPISRKMMHRAVSLEGSPENGTQIHIPSSAGEATINASFNREYEREPKKQKINSSHELQLLIISCKARVQRILLLIGAVIVWVIAFAFGIAYLIFKRKLSNFLARIRGGRVSMQ